MRRRTAAVSLLFAVPGASSVAQRTRRRSGARRHSACLPARCQRNSIRCGRLERLQTSAESECRTGFRRAKRRLALRPSCGAAPPYPMPQSDDAPCQTAPRLPKPIAHPDRPRLAPGPRKASPGPPSPAKIAGTAIFQGCQHIFAQNSRQNTLYINGSRRSWLAMSVGLGPELKNRDATAPTAGD